MPLLKEEDMLTPRYPRSSNLELYNLSEIKAALIQLAQNFANSYLNLIPSPFTKMQTITQAWATAREHLTRTLLK